MSITLTAGLHPGMSITLTALEKRIGTITDTNSPLVAASNGI